ncbi:polyketide synthase [Plenodomus lingam]|uniref:polyketide synthase n=1 Tax=Leptosphaeria maculans TaxID=5022 RepID=UPI003329C575|nr:polyketide synthase [Plenodomus lingam]
MDPQLRLSMEGVFEALENDRLVKDPETLPPSYFTGNGAAMYSNRISHFFDLKGQSVTTDTGCSGSMAALHLAAQTIRTGESDMSIVAVAQFMMNPDLYIALSNLGVLSPQGKCLPWDHRANGYGRGEGMAVVILKRLDLALKDGDHIHSVIRESAMNQDGKTSTITTPAKEAQQTLIRDCYSRAGLSLSETAYIEAHMTGTPTGDPIEAESLAKTFGAARAAGDSVYVGSIKANIGHTEPVSGLASIIKTALVLQHQQIPPHLNYEKSNPAIPLQDWNLKLPLSLIGWPEGAPLRASVNNFGYGGTNVHVIMEAAPVSTAKTLHTSEFNTINEVESQQIGPTEASPSYVYIISSRHSAGGLEMGESLALHIRDSIMRDQKPRAIDLAYTLAERRTRFAWTTVVKATSIEELADKLEETLRKPIRATTIPRLGFIFNGQGAQWYAMGRELLARRDEASSRIHDAEISQPANVAIQLCLVDLLTSWNVMPTAVVSHSSGEIAAAYAAGILSFKEALGVAYYRGFLLAAHCTGDALQGGMMAVRLSVDDVQGYIKSTSSGKVVIACVNSPSSVTLSGDIDALTELASMLEDDAVPARKLNVPLAYHSHHMNPIAKSYQNRLDVLLDTGKVPKILVASPVTGELVSHGETLDSKHWVKNLVSPVLFSEALESMVFGSKNVDRHSSSGTQSMNVDILIEVGAHSTLSGAVRETLGNAQLPYLSCLRRNIDAVSTMQDVACDLLVRGYPVSLAGVNFLEGQELNFVHDLPTYAWDHSTSYLVEPRASRQNRYRRFPSHELLGSSVPGASSLTPTWRNFLRVQDLEWLADHQLESKIVFPAAGYISMAIEAVRRLKLSSGAREEPTSYRLRDIDFMTALLISSGQSGTEVVFTLRDCSDKELDYRGWYEFELFSISPSDAWIRHCTGYVSAEDSSKNLKATRALSSDVERVAVADRVRHVRPDAMFAGLRKTGIYHGPAFQNLIGSKITGSSSDTSFMLSPKALAKDEEYVLHPTTLDSIFQTCYFSLPEEAQDRAMMVPKSIGSLTVPRDFGRQNDNKLQSRVRLLHCTSRDAAFKGTVVQAKMSEEADVPLLMHNLRLQKIQAEDDNAGKLFRVHSQGRWEPDILHDVPAKTKASMQIVLSDSGLSDEKDFREAAYHLMFECLAQLQHEESKGWQPFHKRYHHWLQTIVKSVETGQLAHAAALEAHEWLDRSEAAKRSILEKVAAMNAGGELLVKIGRHLTQIIRGDITPLELMMENGLLQRYYTELPQFNNTYQQLRKVLEHYAIKEPGAKILEVGAGTGGATLHALQAFAAMDETNSSKTLLGHYDYTDVSADFFPEAKKKFASWEGRMNFARLNIEIDPIQQGFTAGSYDLIIASQVLHATVSLANTLSNVRKLLKPKGKLIFLEGTQHSIDLELIFGTLPGWWLGEEPERQMSAIADVPTWDRFLKSSGFSGVDMNIGNCEQPEVQVSSVLIATAAAEPSYPSSISIIWGRNAPLAWRKELATAIAAKTGTAPRHETLKDVCPDETTLYLVAIELEYDLVSSMNQVTFEKLRHLLVSSMGIFWVSGGGLIDSQKPLWGLTPGLLRTFRREDMNKRCVHLDFDVSKDLWNAETTNHIMHVFEEGFDYSLENSNMDWEYAVKNSELHVLRYYPDVELDMRCSGIKPMPEHRLWYDDERDLQYQVPEGSGDLLNKIEFLEVPRLVDDVPFGMVEIETKAFGLNFQDLMLALGFVKDVLTLTHEGAGFVKRLGPGTERSGLRIGDRICGAFRGSFASTSMAWWTNIVKIPDEMSWEEAAAFSVAYLTVHVGLDHVARLQKEERILIHSAAGGVGQAAIMWAQHVGAEIFATCGTETKRQFLMDTYNISADHIFSSRDACFASEIIDRTGEQGVDVVLNSLGGPLLKASWGCLADFGRFVEIGKVDLHAAKRLDMTPFGRNITMAGVDLVAYSELRGMVIHNALVALMKLYRSGHLRSLRPITRFNISDMGAAMKHMQSGTHMGKIVLTIEPTAVVNVSPRITSLDLANMNVTHLIVGGLRGVGHAIALRMIEKGARNVLAISRNASSHPNRLELQKTADQHGCKLVIRDCDISSAEELVEIVGSLGDLHMPPIGGVLQAAMVLDVSFFQQPIVIF